MSAHEFPTTHAYIVSLLASVLSCADSLKGVREGHVCRKNQLVELLPIFEKFALGLHRLHKRWWRGLKFLLIQRFSHQEIREFHQLKPGVHSRMIHVLKNIHCFCGTLKISAPRFDHEFSIGTLKNHSGISIRLLGEAQVTTAKPSTQTCMLFIVPCARESILDILAGDREVAPSHTRPMSNDLLINDSLDTRCAMSIS